MTRSGTRFEHVDLLIVRRGEKVTVDVPVQLTGEAARDTLVVHEHDTLSVTADATRLPDHLEVSIEGLEAGTQVTAGDVELPVGVELAADPEQTVAVVTAAPTAEQLEATRPRSRAAEEAEAARRGRGGRGAEASGRRGRGERRGEDRGLIGQQRSRQAPPIAGAPVRRIGAPAVQRTVSGRYGA